MGRLSEVQKIWICTLLDKHLYSLSNLTREYNIHISMITRLYKKYEKTNEVKDLPKPRWSHLIKECGKYQVIWYLKNKEYSTTI